jgi:hypothetical protein
VALSATGVRPVGARRLSQLEALVLDIAFVLGIMALVALVALVARGVDSL